MTKENNFMGIFKLTNIDGRKTLILFFNLTLFGAF